MLTTIIAVISGLGTLAIRQARKAAEINSVRYQFQNIFLALRNYADKRKRGLPPPVFRQPSPEDERSPETSQYFNPGEPALSSWRWAIVPELFCPHCWGIEWQANETWQAPTNAETRNRTDLWPWFCSEAEPLSTIVFAITGPGTAWGDDETEPPLTLADVPNDTILIAEVRNSGVHWMEPGDFDVRTMPRTLNAPDGKGISSRFAEGFHVGFADGEVWFLSNDVGFERLAQFFTIDGAREHDRERELAPYRLQ